MKPKIILTTDRRREMKWKEEESQNLRHPHFIFT